MTGDLTRLGRPDETLAVTGGLPACHTDVIPGPMAIRPGRPTGRPVDEGPVPPTGAGAGRSPACRS